MEEGPAEGVSGGESPKSKLDNCHLLVPESKLRNFSNSKELIESGTVFRLRLLPGSDCGFANQTNRKAGAEICVARSWLRTTHGQRVQQCVKLKRCWCCCCCCCCLLSCCCCCWCCCGIIARDCDCDCAGCCAGCFRKKCQKT